MLVCFVALVVVMEKKHKMLSCEKKEKCSNCKKLLCMTCTTERNNKILCLQCYKLDLLMPFNHLSNKDIPLKTESQMRLELSKAIQMLDADTPIDVVQGLFEKLEILKMHRN